jgi:hypothetical protein
MGAIGEKLGVGHAAFTRRRMAAARIATQSVGSNPQPSPTRSFPARRQTKADVN